MRPLLAVAALCVLSSVSVHAQALQRSRFSDVPAAHPPTYQPPTAPVLGQMGAGFVGLLGGGAAGVLITAGSLKPEDRDARVLLGLLGGALVGTVAGTHWYGRRHGLRSSIVVTTLGATAGMILAYAAPVTMPIGATVAYNLVRRER